MKRVARRVTLNLAESKRMSVIEQAVFSNTTATTFRWTYRNLFAQLPTATGALAGSSFAVDGNEIVDPLLKFKTLWTIPFEGIAFSESSASYGTVVCHIYLVAANDFTTTVDGGSPSPGTFAFTPYPGQYSTGDMGWFLNQDPYKPTLNGNNVRVLKKWTKRYHPDQLIRTVTAGSTAAALGRVHLTMTGKYRWRRKLTYEDYPFGDLDSNFPRSGVLRGWNYYLLVGWGAPGVLTQSTSQPQADMDTFLYFKDP